MAGQAIADPGTQFDPVAVAKLHCIAAQVQLQVEIFQTFGGRLQHLQVPKTVRGELAHIGIGGSGTDQVTDATALHQRQWVEGQLAELVVVCRVVLAMQLAFFEQGGLQGLENGIGHLRGMQVHVRAYVGDLVQPARGLVATAQALELLAGMVEASIQCLEHTAGQ
ncbi:hypothetical protein D9M73_143440 [compost metagenome]